MSQTKHKKRVSVNTKELLAGIQALTIFYEEKTDAFIDIKEEYGNEHPATIALFEEVNTLGDILNYFSSLVGDQLKNNGERYN